MAEPLHVVVTGAAGQMAYSFLFILARGEVFGKNQPLVLHLLEIPPALGALNGVIMEIEDCAFPLVKEIIGTADPEEGFKDVDYAVLIGSFPRKEGMLRADLLKKNASIFKGQGEAINNFAKKTCKVVVVGNPANTNCAILRKFAPDLPNENFSALTRLDHNRATNQLAQKAGVSPNDVKKVTIWGNHSKTQFPDFHFSTINGNPVEQTIDDSEWLKNDYIEIVQTRGAAIIQARKLSSAASAAKAIGDHVKNWHFGTEEGNWVSMAIPSDGSYGIDEGIIYSFPVTIENGNVSIVQELPINDFQREKMNATLDELKQERETAFSLFDN